MLGFNRVTGGVHPDEHKETSVIPIQYDLPLPERFFLPLAQHAGSDAVPVVKLGERVLKGQRIGASACGNLSANLHAPTSGIITAIGPVTAPHPSGLPALALTLEPDGDDTWGILTPPPDPMSMNPEDLATLVEAAGIVGMGGAIFPAAVKLRQGRRFEIKTLLINGSECEPFLTTDDVLMQAHADAIIDGAQLVRYIIEAYRVVIAVENNKPRAIAALRAAAAKVGSVEIMEVPTLYPTGSAKQLIQAVTGEEVPAGARSNDIGVLVHNVGTIYAIQQALRLGRPLISRITTVTGGCVREPQNVEARIGTPVSHLLQHCGGMTEAPARLLMGGPMMGQVIPSLDVPIIKGSTGVLALNRREVNERVPSPCIRCSRCVEACPMGLVPLEMARHTRTDDFEGALQYGLKDCILCGSCSYVCPSHIPLVQYFEFGKGELRDRQLSDRKATYTRELATERSARMEREAEAKRAAKAAKKKARKPKAKAAASASADQASSASAQQENSQ